MTDKLTIRDQFAMAALTGLCANPTATNIIITAYNLAEQMLEIKQSIELQEIFDERQKQKESETLDSYLLAEKLYPELFKHRKEAADKKQKTEEICHELGAWLSAALDDPNVCQEYKDVIERWFAAGQPAYTTPAKLPLSKLPPDNLTA